MQKVQAIEKLKRQRDEVDSLMDCGYLSPRFTRWQRNTEVAIEYIFGKEGRHLPEFKAVPYEPASGPLFGSEGYYEEAKRKGLLRARSILDSMIQEIEEFRDDTSDLAANDAAPLLPSTNKVFIVHGHDKAALLMVARLLEKLKLEPVILHEQPNAGRTLIEKFVDSSDVPYAVVLLTADDWGGTKEILFEDRKPRARQNVILELGYFYGRLGRQHVCVLYEEGVERPSDIDGIAYVPLDSRGAWKIGLVRELRTAGFSVDMNDIT